MTQGQARATMPDPPEYRRKAEMNATCQWLVDKVGEPQPMTCGKPAVSEVTVKTKITQAKVSLCAEHKRQHNVQFAQARTNKS